MSDRDLYSGLIRLYILYHAGKEEIFGLGIIEEQGPGAQLITMPRPLHEQREWLRVTLSSIGDAAITTDTKGSITYVNPVAVSLTGWTQEEAAGTSDRLDLIVASAGARKR